MAKIDKLLSSTGSHTTADLMLHTQKVMQTNAGVFRNEELLKEGCNQILDAFKQFDDVKVRMV